MGSVFTCKLNPCCGDRRNCDPPRQYYDEPDEFPEPAALSTPQAGDLGAVKVNDRAKEKLKLWFFRDLNDEQRLKLFSLFEMPTDEIGEAHGRQSIALKHVLSALSSSPVGEMEDRAVAKTDALIDARDCMSRAADIFEYIGRAEEADRLRRSADCCRIALASSGGGR